MRSDRDSENLSTFLIIFQSTLLHEKRHIDIIYTNPIIKFQSTLLHEKRPIASKSWVSLGIFQSTLLHEKRLTIYCISINSYEYFNPRSYMRSDNNSNLYSCCDWYFNPRSYMRSDLHLVGKWDRHLNFNPRSYMRSDVFRLIHLIYVLLFQSTLLHEKRRFYIPVL